MPQKPPKSIFDVKLRPEWRTSHRFVGIGMQYSLGTKRSKHFAGGVAPKKGGKCQQCKNPLTLLWEVDLQSLAIANFVTAGFAPTRRLPMLICWRCLAASYRILSDDEIKCFPFDAQTDFLRDNESPFIDTPTTLPRRPIGFRRIPSTIDALLSLAGVIGVDQLDDAAKRTLHDFRGDAISTDWDLPISQFGGLPNAYQGRRNFVCPNPKCPASKLEHPYGELVTPYLMKELALIDWKDEPVLAVHGFQIVYFVCIVCFSLRVEYRCD